MLPSTVRKGGEQPKPLCRLYAIGPKSASRLDPPQPISTATKQVENVMADAAYIALGLGIIALMAAYALWAARA